MLSAFKGKTSNSRLTALEKILGLCHSPTVLKQLISDWAVPAAWQHHRWQEQVSINLLQTLSSQTSVVPWARVMASLHWAALCYCRITERLIETNDSNNGTLSPQAGFVVGLISVAVAARRTSHHADPSKEAAEAPFLAGSTGFSYKQCVRVPGFF